MNFAKLINIIKNNFDRQNNFFGISLTSEDWDSIISSALAYSYPDRFYLTDGGNLIFIGDEDNNVPKITIGDLKTALKNLYTNITDSQDKTTIADTETEVRSFRKRTTARY